MYDRAAVYIMSPCRILPFKNIFTHSGMHVYVKFYFPIFADKEERPEFLWVLYGINTWQAFVQKYYLYIH